LTKTPLLNSISYFNLGGWELCLGANRTKAPMATRIGPEQLNEATLGIAHEICD